MEFLQLVYFCSAAETENFAKTAREFNVPPASISQSIKRLEKEVGATLFDRSPNGVKLNELGRIWYHSSKSSLLMLEDAHKKIKEEEVSGTIRLLVVTNRYMVRDAIGSFLQKHKNVSFVVDYYAKDAYDKYDLFITDNVDSSYVLKDYTFNELINDDIVLAVNKNHPLAQKEEILTEDLENETFITLSKDSGLFTVSRRILNKKKIPLDSVYQCDDPENVIKFVEMGIGVAIVPRQAWHCIFTDNIRIKKMTGLVNGLYLKRAQVGRFANKYLPKSVREFLVELLETAEKYKTY